LERGGRGRGLIRGLRVAFVLAGFGSGRKERCSVTTGSIRVQWWACLLDLLVEI
jgi:hypothetical protein